jgi:hypothetical protein
MTLLYLEGQQRVITMNIIKKYLRRRIIKNLEREIAKHYSKSIQEFLSKPVIAQLDIHFSRQNEIQQKLDSNRRERDKLANSNLWGNRFAADGYYRWNDELKDEFKNRTVKIHEIYNLLGFEITEENLNRLKKEATFFERKTSLLDKKAREAIALDNHLSSIAARQMVKASAIAGGLGIVFSAGYSFEKSMNVYDALRRANSNFAELSNEDIWFETMLLSIINPDSYQGMVNLAKGAYFEQLVANDTGGTLHDNFNTQASDMLLNGSLVQLKATDEQAVVSEIEPDITVIATSEVASKTSAIDSGYSNEQITQTTERALGGDVIDTSGSLSDGALIFSGGLGVLASLKGICVAGEYLDKNPPKRTGDEFENLEESLTQLTYASAVGLEVAIVSTLEALPSVWNLALTIIRYALNALHVVLYPLVRILG